MLVMVAKYKCLESSVYALQSGPTEFLMDEHGPRIKNEEAEAGAGRLRPA